MSTFHDGGHSNFVLPQHFEDIECEWPMFYINLVLNAMFSSHQERIEEYWAKLEKIIVSEEQCKLVCGMVNVCT